MKEINATIEGHKIAYCLALLCATAQRSYCIVMVLESIRPCVEPVFSETIKRINAKLCIKVYLLAIYHDNFFFFLGGGSKS